MKQVFKKLGCILVLVLAVILTGCMVKGGKVDEKLTVRIDDKIIKSVKLDDADGIDVFKDGFSRDDLFTAELVELGKKVYLDFDGNMPDDIEVLDSILTPEGDFLYDEKNTVVVACESDDNGYYFLLSKNLASAFSSISGPGWLDLRGFRVKASWGGDEVVYGFVIKTVGNN